MKLGPIGTPGEIVARLAGEHRQSLAALSRLLRRRDSYLATFVREVPPAVLAKPDRALLGALFRVPGWLFGEETGNAEGTVRSRPNPPKWKMVLFWTALSVTGALLGINIVRGIATGIWNW